MSWIEPTTAARSTSSGTEQNTVSRMMSGGVAGFRTMIAFPIPAPPSLSTPWAVVRVNSSMFARVPGPA